MTARRVLVLPIAATLTAIAVGALSSQTSHAQTAPPRAAFLTPLPPPTVVQSTSPFCRGLQGRQCAPVLTYGGAARHDLPTIEPKIKADLPHVRVSFVLEEISHAVVANSGITTGAMVEWLTTGSAAAVENGGPWTYSLPPANVTWDEDDLHHTLLYDALVFNACESFPVFPVVHDTAIEQNGGDIGVFHGVDNSTIDHTGYYHFSYTVRATGMNGRVSDFRFSGKVDVLCSGLLALP
jgi:hypothetical protein